MHEEIVKKVKELYFNSPIFHGWILVVKIYNSQLMGKKFHTNQSCYWLDQFSWYKNWIDLKGKKKLGSSAHCHQIPQGKKKREKRATTHKGHLKIHPGVLSCKFIKETKIWLLVIMQV